MNPGTLKWIAGNAFFLAFAVASVFLGGVAAARVMGLAMIWGGVSQIRQGSLAVGIMGREPSFHLGRRAALVAGLVAIALGGYFLVWPGHAACAVHWLKGPACR